MREAAYHFTLLAEDEIGYRNLVKLISTAHLDGFHYRPRIDKELLAQHSAGLIGLSGCLAGEVNSAIQANNIQQSDASRGGVSRHSWAGEFLRRTARSRNRRTKVQRRAAEDGEGSWGRTGRGERCPFSRRDDHDAHDVMLCIGTGKMVQDEARMRYVPELYFKSPAEMRALFKDHPDAITNTLAIAERCDLTIEFGRSKYPEYPVPAGAHPRGISARALRARTRGALRRDARRPTLNCANASPTS